MEYNNTFDILPSPTGAAGRDLSVASNLMPIGDRGVSWQSDG